VGQTHKTSRPNQPPVLDHSTCLHVALHRGLVAGGRGDVCPRRKVPSVDLLDGLGLVEHRARRPGVSWGESDAWVVVWTDQCAYAMEFRGPGDPVRRKTKRRIQHQQCACAYQSKGSRGSPSSSSKSVPMPPSLITTDCLSRMAAKGLLAAGAGGVGDGGSAILLLAARGTGLDTTGGVSFFASGLWPAAACPLIESRIEISLPAAQPDSTIDPTLLAWETTRPRPRRSSIFGPWAGN